MVNKLITGDENPLVDFLLETLSVVGLQVEHDPLDGTQTHQGQGQGQRRRGHHPGQGHNDTKSHTSLSITLSCPE